jgi:hypothetical protein
MERCLVKARRSAQWQKWMDDPSDTGCKVSPSALTLKDLFQAKDGM